MKPQFFTAFLAGMALLSSCDKDKAPAVATVAYELMETQSVAHWKGYLGTGYFNEGSIAVRSAQLQARNGQLTGGTFVLPLASIQSLNLPDAQKPALEGFYFAPFVRYQNLTLTVKDEYPSIGGGSITEAKASLNTYGGGVLAGYQLLFKKRFTLDTFLGPSFNDGKVKVTAGDVSQTFDAGTFTGFGLRAGVTFGVAF